MAKLVKSSYESYVYLIGYGNKIKIGKANRPNIRLSQLQVGIPDEISLIGAIGCASEEDALELEDFLHKEYRHRHIRAEWYTLTSEDCVGILKKYVDMLNVEIPQAEILAMMSDLTSGAKDLLLYYYSRNDGWRFDDENIAKFIKSSERQVKKFRRELIAKQYLLIQKGEVDVYFIGRLAVEKFKKEISEVPDDEDPTDPLITKGSK